MAKARTKGNEYDYLSKKGSVLTGKKITAHPAEEPGALGYTMMGSDESADIYVAQEHELYAGLTEKEKKQTRIGVGVHEILHQMYTDFEVEDRYASRIPGVGKYLSEGSERYRRFIFHQFANIVEDVGIESRGIEELGGYPIKCLKKAIVTIYDQTEPIDAATSAFSQYMGAIINIGDLGCVKGKWTFPEAEKICKASLPVYIEGMKSHSPIKRVHCAFQMMQISEPLWKNEEEEAKKSEESMKKLMEELRKELAKKRSGSESDDDGDGDSGGDSDSDSSSSRSSSKSSKRKGKPSDKGYDPSSELSELLTEMSNSGDSDDEESSEGKKDAPSKQSVEEIERQMEEILKEKSDVRGDSKFSRKESEDFEEDIESSVEEKAKNDEFKLVETPKQYNKAYKVGNEKIPAKGNEAQYAAIRKPIAGQIAFLSKRLATIFEAKSEEEWAQKGKFNVKRYATHETSTRWFQRNTESKGDVAVEILVDESGSMCCGNKYAKARLAVVMFAEACRANKIPCYVMGFSADERGYDVYHRHYVGWSLGDPLESLAEISAHHNNFDGYSIRAAGEIIKKRQETTRLLIVISDGEPAAIAYSRIDGDTDTKNAIDHVRKNGIEVFGIGIEGCGPEKLQKFYGASDCLYLADPNQLGMTMFKKLKDSIEKRK